MKKISLWFVVLLLIASILAGCAKTPTVVPTQAPAAATPTTQPTIRPADFTRLVLATTTSTEDSGLLEYLLPDFEKEFNTKVDVIAVGTGQAIQLGKDGNADVLLVHARSQEDAFMDAGDGVRREDVMYNDFVIIGPESDPAGIAGMTSAVDALRKLHHQNRPLFPVEINQEPIPRSWQSGNWLRSLRKAIGM